MLSNTKGKVDGALAIALNTVQSNVSIVSGYFSGALAFHRDILLVRLPTPPRRTLSMAMTNSCTTGREIPRTSNNQSYIHDNSPGDSPKDRPRKSWTANTPNYWKYCTSDLVLQYSTRILGCKQKCQIEALRYRLAASSQVTSAASPQ